VRPKDEFDTAYEMLCDELYKAGGYAYKDMPGGDGEAEDSINDLVELKGQVDSKMKYHVRTIYKKLRIKYEHDV
jgi:hypothetical protein